MSEKEKVQKFTLEDLNPRPCTIEVILGGQVKRFALRKFNLFAQLWARKEWGNEEALNEALNPKSEINEKTSKSAYIEAICKITHHLLEDKTEFPTWEDFAMSIGSGPTEILNLERAFLLVMGMSQPLADKSVDAAKKKMMAAMTKKKGGT